jgi:hypothetical protein
MLLVELVTALLVERADGLRDRRVLAIGFGDPFYRLLVFGVGEPGAGRGPESDRDRAVGLAAWLSVLGSERSSFVSWPTVLATPTIVRATASQTTRTHTG